MNFEVKVTIELKKGEDEAKTSEGAAKLEGRGCLDPMLMQTR